MPKYHLLTVLVFLSISGQLGCIRDRRENPTNPAIPGGESPLSVLPAPESPNVPRPTSNIPIPRSETMPGAVPLMPGLPGTASRPLQNSVEGDLLQASAEDPPTSRKGPLRRWMDERRARREDERKIPELPSPFEPVKSTGPTKGAPKIEPPKLEDPLPVPLQMPLGPPSISAPAAAPIRDIAKIRELVSEAGKYYDSIPGYQAHMIRQETVKGTQMPKEEMEVLYRKDPLSIYMKVVGENGKGREILYVKGQNDNKLTVVTGQGDNRLLGVGKKLELSLDSPLITGKNRVSIDQSGFGRPIGILSNLLQQAEQGRRAEDTLIYLGAVKKPESALPLTGVVVKLVPGDDPLLPKGGRREYYFCQDEKSAGNHLPVLILTYDEAQKLVEYYYFDDFRIPAKFSDADFSSARLGGRNR